MLFLALAGLLLHGGGAQHICAWSSPMNDVDRGLFLDILNTYRAYVARGEAYQLNGKLSGSNELFELKYDCQLELMAHMNTYSCNQTFHPPATSINYFMFVNEPHAWSKRDLIPMAASSWYQPVLDFWNKSDPRLESFVNIRLMPRRARFFHCRRQLMNHIGQQERTIQVRSPQKASLRGQPKHPTQLRSAQKEKLRGQPKTSTQLRSAQKAELRGQPKNSTQ
ncbi:hypothetical protein GCK32_012180, partial [Trichostrongylus colubriformis]